MSKLGDNCLVLRNKRTEEEKGFSANVDVTYLLFNALSQEKRTSNKQSIYLTPDGE